MIRRLGIFMALMGVFALGAADATIEIVKSSTKLPNVSKHLKQANQKNPPTLNLTKQGELTSSHK